MCIGRNQINTQITTVLKHIKLNIFLRMQEEVLMHLGGFLCRHELP